MDSEMTRLTARGSEGLLEPCEIEQYRYSEEIDWSYVLDVAADVANALALGTVIEAAFQPGDGTRYALVFVPLERIATAIGRVVDGVPWSRKAVEGVDYIPGVALVCQVESGPSYPLRFFPRGDLSIDYVAEHWKLPGASAVVVTALFRAIAQRLETFERQRAGSRELARSLRARAEARE